MRLSEKLGALFAGAAMLPLLVTALVVLSQLSSHAHHQADESLQREARSASAIYDKRLSELRAAAQRLGDDIANRALVSNDAGRSNPAASPQARIQDMLSRALQDDGLDFVIVADTQGRVIARYNDRPAPTETIIGGDYANAVAAEALNRNRALAAAAIEPVAQLKTLGLDLRAQVKLAEGATMDDALMIEAAAPIQGGGRLVGVALIGQMVNNDSKPRLGASALQTPLVAEIRQTLYHQAEEDAGAIVACQNLILASSGADAVAALMGARCDTAPDATVITQSNESYVVAWQSMKAIDGTDVGRLGVARNARELAGATPAVRTALLVIAAVAVVLAGAGGFFYGRALGSRLDGLNEAVARWSVGELSAPAADQPPALPGLARFTGRDEISRLALSLEQMRESFRQALDRLRHKR
jgi:HAMP domain-containing protein